MYEKAVTRRGRGGDGFSLSDSVHKDSLMIQGMD
jgi:hypothetical protein